MKSKIIIATILVATLTVCLLAFMGCQTPATLSITNNGEVVQVIVGGNVNIPVKIDGELTDKQTLTYTVEIGRDSIISINSDNTVITGVAEGYALIRVALDDTVFPIEVKVSADPAVAQAFNASVTAAKSTVTGFALPDEVTAMPDGELKTALTDEFNAYRNSSAAVLNRALNNEMLTAFLADAVAKLTIANEAVAVKAESLAAVEAFALTSANSQFEGLDAAKVDAAIAAVEAEFTAAKASYIDHIKATPIDDLAAMKDAFVFAMQGYMRYLDVVRTDVLLADLSDYVDASDTALNDRIDSLKTALEAADGELKDQIDAAVEAIEFMQSIDGIRFKQVNYNGEKQTLGTTPAGVDSVEYSYNGANWVAMGDGVTDAGTYNIRYKKSITIGASAIECYAYGSLIINQITIGGPIWPTVADPSGYVIYTQLKDIPLVGGVAGEGSPNDDVPYGGNDMGYFKWYEEERELDPVNFGGYYVELVPHDTVNFRPLRQLVAVPVKDAFVTITPVEGQWKNYDRVTPSTANGDPIEYTFEVYSDAARTQLVPMNSKLLAYVSANLVGELQLNDDVLTVAVEPAKDSGNWGINVGTLQTVAGARFSFAFNDLNSQNVAITYEIKPLTITAVNNLSVDKYYDGTVAAPDTEYSFTDYTVEGVDENGNPVSLPIVTSDILSASVAGASYEDKNAATDKVVVLNGSTVTLKESGALPRNYVFATDIINNIAITGTIYERPITRLTGRIETRMYDGTDIADYTKAYLHSVAVQLVDVATGKLIADMTDDITNVAVISADDVHITLQNYGKYVSTAGTNDGKNVGTNKNVLFNNGIQNDGSQVTSWTLEGADAANYVYVGALNDTDPNKHEKVTYVGDIIKLPALGNVEIGGLLAEKGYDGSDICSDTPDPLGLGITDEGDLKRDPAGNIIYDVTFVGAITTITGDVITIDSVIGDGIYTDDGTTGVSNIGDHQVAFDVVNSFVLGGDAANYDWTGVVARGEGVITPRTIEFANPVGLNSRVYDGTPTAYIDNLLNFDSTTGILSGVVFSNLIAGDDFQVRILKDEATGLYPNGVFTDKNVAIGKNGTWAAGTWELVAVSGDINNYTFKTVDLPIIGDITHKTINSVVFNLIQRTYDAEVTAYLNQVSGTAYDKNGVTGTVVGSTDTFDADIQIVGMIEGDDLSVLIKTDGKFKTKAAALEKEALFEEWDILGVDAQNYYFSPDIPVGETAPVTTVKGVGVVAPKQITAITINNATVGLTYSRGYNENAIVAYNIINALIDPTLATYDPNVKVTFEGIIENDDLSIVLTADGEFGDYVNGVWTTSSEVGAHSIRFLHKRAEGADRDNYYIERTEVIVLNAEIVP